MPPNMDYPFFEGHEEVPFSWQPGLCNLGAAWWLSELALLAYEHPRFIEMTLRWLGATHYRFFDIHTMQCFVCVLHQRCIVSFRGTELTSMKSFADIRSDLNIAMTDFHGYGLVHQGFSEAFAEVFSGETPMWDYVHQVMASAEVSEVYFTGHSLGGAIATLAAVYFGDEAGPLITFGAPRVGSEQFATHLPADTWRFVNEGDIVSVVPPNLREEEPERRWGHGGELIYVLKNGEIQRNPEDAQHHALDVVTEQIRNTAASIWDAIIGLGKDPDSPAGDDTTPGTVTRTLRDATLDAHAPGRYSTNIWNALARTGVWEI